jgi:hypothetical protein
MLHYTSSVEGSKKRSLNQRSFELDIFTSNVSSRKISFEHEVVLMTPACRQNVIIPIFFGPEALR